MPITPTNATKNTITPSVTSKTGTFLLMEDGSYLLQENGDKIILDLEYYGFTATNMTKNNITATNQVKN